MLGGWCHSGRGGGGDPGVGAGERGERSQQKLGVHTNLRTLLLLLALPRDLGILPLDDRKRADEGPAIRFLIQMIFSISHYLFTNENHAFNDF